MNITTDDNKVVKHAEFIKSLTEIEAIELVIIPLLDALGYKEIRLNHGPSEYGKDILFVSDEKLGGRRQYAAVVWTCHGIVPCP